MKKFWLTIATFFYTGHLPVAPGTWASLVTTAAVYLLIPYQPENPNLAGYIKLGLAVLVFIIGVPAAYVAEKHYGKKDPRPCVIDEVAGQIIPLIMIPYEIHFYIVAFFVFRGFDIMKPPPIAQVESLPGGWGIMLDDVMAGVFSFALMQVFKHFI